MMLEDPVFLVAANLSVAVLLRILKPNLMTAALLAFVVIASTAYLGKQHGSEIVRAAHRGRDAVLTWSGQTPAWPPEKNRTYPDIELVDHDGNVTRMSDFKGKVILVEPVGIPCEACVAFSGGHEFGPFDGIEPQAGLESIDAYASQFGNVRLDDERIVRVQLLLFNQAMLAPTQAEAAAWVDHFQIHRSSNQVVLVGTPGLATAVSRNLVPGFQLIDRHFILRSDSTGETPVDDLYTKLLPQIRTLLEER